MPDTDKQSIEEALCAIDRIQEYVNVVPRKEIFTSNQMAHDAILMQFIVLGESCSKISNELKEKNRQIDWRGANDFRNFLAHDYFGVSDDVVWSVIQFHLPQLKSDLEKLSNR